MKKLILPLLAAAVATAPAMADNTSDVRRASSAVAEKSLCIHKADAAEKPGLTVDDAIHVAPEGKVSDFSRSGEAYYNNYGNIKLGTFQGVASEIVECDNGDVYLKNPVSLLKTGLYIKGRKEEGKLVFDLPQVAYLEPYYGQLYPYKLTTMVLGKDGETYYPVNTEAAANAGIAPMEDKMVIEMLPDGSYQYAAPEDLSTLVGLVACDSEQWGGYAEVKSTWTPFNMTAVTPPVGLVTEDIIIHSLSTDPFYAKIGYNGKDEVYVQGMFSAMPEAWVKGTRTDGKFVFESGQYIGIEPVNNIYTYFVAGRYTMVQNPSTGGMTPIINHIDRLTLENDSEEKIYAAPAEETAVLSGLPDKVAYLEYLREPMIQWVPADMSYNPATPEIEEYSYSDIYGDLLVRFKISDFNVDGLPLNHKNLYYSCYVDGELYTFTTETYPGLPEDMSLLPIDITDGRDIQIFYGVHELFFYFGEKPVGIKVFYVEDGKVLGESEMAIAKSAGINDVTVDKAVAGVEYYTIAGQRVTRPSCGLYVKVINYTDGSRESVKVSVK